MMVLTAPSGDFLLTADEMKRHGTATVVLEATRILSDDDIRVTSGGDIRIVQETTVIDTFLLVAPSDDFLLTA